ncbi:hypothetical protein BaRGS_00026205, partial [Batillaria attramentaria]
MSQIEKMSIMGIRSFGPEDRDRQIIQFQSPLTLILGPNGTGKTTVIECLKYITTGDQPPNSKGGAFVHDPKVAHETVVRAQVRLQLRDVAGKIMQVQRSMEATQKLKKVEVRTLDSVITRIGPDGQKVSANSKCLDFDREMVTALGVPKPVLDNVIFCHQEDSCWPLSEGKALKDKFDAIFASTRYVKVLDTIRKLKQEQDGNIKLYKEEIRYLKQHKEKAEQLERDLAELEAESAASKDSIAKIEEKLQPVRERLIEIGERYEEIFRLQTKVEKSKSEKEQMEKSIKDLQDNIENEFQGSTAELEKLLSEFADKVQERKDTLTQFERRKEGVTRELEKLNGEKSRLLVEVGKLEQEAETHDDNIRKRDADIRKLAAEFGFEGFDRGAITDERYKTFFDRVRHKLEAMSADVSKVKADFEEQERTLQHKMDAARDKKTQLEQTQHFKREQMDKNKREIREIRKKLSDMEASAGRLDHLEQELKSAERDLAVAETTVNLDELKREITQLDKERRQLDAQMNELNSEMSRLHLQSSTRTQLDMMKKEKTAKEDNIRRIKAKHEDSLIHLLGGIPGSNIRGRLEDYLGRQSDMTRKCSCEIQKAKNLLSQKEAEKNMLNKQVREKEDEVRALEERIFNVCGSQDFEEGFQTVQQKLSETQDQRGSLVGAEHFFKKYKRELEKHNPACPLCHREFEADQEVRELVLELATIRGTDLPNLKDRLQKVNEDIHKLRETVEEKSEDLSMKESDEAMAREMQPDIILMDRVQGELRELDKKIASQSALLAGGDSERTLQVVIDEKDDVQMKLDTVTRKLEHKRQKQSDHTDRVQALRASVNSLQAEKLKIDAELQQRTKLEERQAQLSSDNIEHDADIKAAQDQLRPLEEEMRQRKREKDDVTESKELAVEEGKAGMEDVRSKGNNIKSINHNIKLYIQSGKQERLEKSRERQQEIAGHQRKIETELEELSANINKLRKDVATQQIRERELSDNLQLRKKQQDVKRLERQIADLEEQLGGLDPRNLERERQKLRMKDDEYNKELNKASGRLLGFDDQIRTTKRELQSDMFRDATRKYRDKMIDLRTTELANGDLEKYYKAMDRAIMSYHAQKMAEINKIIRELWRNTYRGNDIDTIEIRSDDDESGGSLRTRRTYNYRVVMLKGDTALDMRGRCSAGQKVLACLLIRLALAETFCMNCGVFALDEPTTNLDRENIESLAHALVKIVETRRRQRNFQLVIITHDEDFVELLGRSNFAEQYIKVSKND